MRKLSTQSRRSKRRPVVTASDQASMAPRLTLLGATLHGSPTDAPIGDSVVIVDGHGIVAAGPRGLVPVPDDGELIDCEGMTVTAGFWNSHVHFFERKWADASAIPAAELDLQLRDFAKYGFTSVFDLSSMWRNTRQLRERIESGEVRGPRIRTTGEGLVPPGALPPEAISAFMGLMKTPLPEIESAAQATSAATRLLDEGVDAIKVFASGQSGSTLAQHAIEAVIRTAHGRGKLVFCHPNTADDVASALRAGVDIIAHTTPRSTWDNVVLDLIRERRPALTPTLRLWKFFLRHDRASMQDTIAAGAIAQLRDWIASGGEVLFGTDAGAVHVDPTEEYVMMEQAGMTFRDILASLTTTPAALFGEGKRLGRVATGFLADLVVVKGDPAKDIRALSDVRYTLRSGSVIYRA